MTLATQNSVPAHRASTPRRRWSAHVRRTARREGGEAPQAAGYPNAVDPPHWEVGSGGENRAGAEMTVVGEDPKLPQIIISYTQGVRLTSSPRLPSLDYTSDKK